MDLREPVGRETKPEICILMDILTRDKCDDISLLSDATLKSTRFAAFVLNKSPKLYKAFPNDTLADADVAHAVVRRDHSLFRELPKKARGIPEVALVAIRKVAANYRHTAEPARSNVAVGRAASLKSGVKLEWFPRPLRGDWHISVNCASLAAPNLEFVPPKLRETRSWWAQVCTNNFSRLSDAPPTWRDSGEFVLDIIAKGTKFATLPGALAGDLAFMKRLVTVTQIPLSALEEPALSDPGFYITGIKSNNITITQIARMDVLSGLTMPDAMRANEEVVAAAALAHPETFAWFASKAHRDNEELVGHIYRQLPSRGRKILARGISSRLAESLTLHNESRFIKG